MIKKITFCAILSLLLSFSSKGQYTQILHTSGTQQYNCTNVEVGPFWWYYYYQQNQYWNGTNWTCGVGPYSDSTWNNQQYYYGWGGYQFKFTPTVTGVRFQIADMQYGEWVEFFVNGQYYTLTNANITAFPGTCGQTLVNNYGYLYNTVQNTTAGAQVDINGSIDSVAVWTSGGWYYYNNNSHEITYSAYFIDPNYINLTASSNNPNCGGILTLSASNVTGAISYSWTGPNNFTSNQQNPTVGTATYLQSGTYTVTVVTACGTTTASVTVNIVTPTPPTANSPIDYCVGQASSALTATGTNLLWYTSQTGGTGSSTAPIPSTTIAGTFTWWVSQTINGCESDRTAVTVNVYAVPSAPGVSSNSPVCSGSQITLNATSGNNATFAWTGPNSFSSTLASPTINGAQSIHAGIYSVTSTINGCTSPPATLTVVVNPTPAVTTTTPQNPTTCGGTNGSITLSGLTANTNYTITYSKNNIAQPPVTVMANGSGQAIISGLGSGTYSSIVVSLNGCTATIAGPFTLTDPVAPNITLTSTNNTNCATPTGSITLHNLVAGTYTVNYSFNGTPQAPQTVTITGSQITLSNLAHGSYTNITVTNTTTNCISNILSVTINGPVVPTIYSQVTNPSACGSSTGSILITGLVSGTSYTVNYTQNGNPLTLTQTAVNGGITISGLPAGTYTNVFIVVNGCTTNVLGPLTLVDPNAPTTPVVTSNGPICAGSTLILSMTPIPLGTVTYSWSGPNGFSSGLQSPTIPNAQTNASGTYTVTVSVNGCISAPGSATVVVNPIPATPTAAANTPVCSGNTLNLSATSTTTTATYVWSGPNTFSSTQQNPTIPSVTTAATGLYTVYATDNGCNSLPYSFNVNVTATPVITATHVNPTACGTNNGSITLQGLVTGSNYSINYDKNGIPQGVLNLTAAAGSVTIANLGVGTYTNITASLNGCPSNILGPITLLGPIQPATPTPAANDPLCEGDILQLTATTVTNATYDWTGPNGFTASTQNASLGNVTVAAAGTYSVIATVNGCTSVPGTVNVVINPQPATPAVGNNGPVCEGNPVNLQSNNIPGVTYSWTGPNTYTSSLQNPTIPNAQLGDAGLYTLTVSNGTCDATASTNVAVGPLPALPVVNSPLEVCVGETVTLTAQGQNLAWYTQPTGGVGQATIIPPTTTATTLTYYVSQSNNGCEGPRAPLVVIVHPLPAPPTATATYTYCQDEPATQLTATGTNLQWYDVATGGTPLAGAPTPNTAIPGVFNYYVTQADINCESQRTGITVTIHPTPAAPQVANKEYCRDDAATALTASGQDLLWYTTPTGGIGSVTAPVPNTTTTGTTEYYVSQTQNGCEGDRAPIRVTVHEKVSASLTANPEDACTGKPVTITFTGAAPDSATYSWTFDGATIQSGTDEGPYIVEWNNSGTKTVTVIVSNHVCTATASVVIDVDPTPEAHFVMDDHGCVDGPVTVVADSNLGGLPGYTWSFGGAEILSGTAAGPYSLIWRNTGTKLVSLQLTGINCPSEPYFDSVTIHQPLAKINWDHSSQICSDDSVLFTAEPGLDNAYAWWPATHFRKDRASLSAWAIVPTTSYVYLTVYDRWGCEAYDSTLVKTEPCCDVFLPNAFTPNADGKNDGFRMLTKGKQQISRFIIVDRWGKILFETANQYEAWDGAYNGAAMPIGTYQYYLKYRCAEGSEMIEKKGDVTLIR